MSQTLIALVAVCSVLGVLCEPQFTFSYLGVPQPASVGYLGVPQSASVGYLGVPQPVSVGYLGVPQQALGYTLPYRTALDIFQTGVPTVYSYPQYASTFSNLYGHYYPFNTVAAAIPQAPFAITAGFPTILPAQTSTVTVTRDQADSTVVQAEEEAAAVEVGVEESTEEEKDGSSVITIKQTVDALPDVPVSIGFRGVPVPPIPAGIVQATQPKYIQVPFQNAKLSPGFPFLVNSKISPVLQGLREDAAGIIRI